MTTRISRKMAAMLAVAVGMATACGGSDVDGDDGGGRDEGTEGQEDGTEGAEGEDGVECAESAVEGAVRCCDVCGNAIQECQKIWWGPGTDNYERCCVAGDPCGVANNGWCECDGRYNWDSDDCARSNKDNCTLICEDSFTQAKDNGCIASLMAAFECELREKSYCLSLKELPHECEVQWFAWNECVSDSDDNAAEGFEDVEAGPLCTSEGRCAGGNKACPGRYELCMAEYGTCAEVPCYSDSDCEEVGRCDSPDGTGSGSFQCDFDFGACKRD